jgi:signal transduction histidine kinase
MELLHDVLFDRRDEVIQRWKAMVQGTLSPESMSSVELIDHLPTFLREVIAALRAEAGLDSVTLPPDLTHTASDHGEQRLRLGFSLDSVVREYGALGDAIFETARAAGVHVAVDELRVISASTIHGIAGAVVEYSRQRDAELQRQHNEHFAFLAHELRNPLGTALMAIDLLKTRAAIEVDARETNALERGLQRMHELIDHSLDVARVASGIELRRERTRLKALLAEAEGFAMVEALQKQIAVHVQIDQDDDVYLDLRLVRSALSNLVRNAVKYSAAGGSVDLRGKVDGGHVTIEVEDCCGGLEPGKVEQAFAPFVRLDRAESGFGLGLAIAKQAADAHGGSIRVQNLPSKGCMFVLELPRLPSDAASP